MSSQAVIYAVRAKHRGEVRGHLITRAAFLRHVLADARTRDRFARWRRESRLDLVIAEWSAQLETAAAQVGLPHRSALLHDTPAHARVAAPLRRFLDECAKVYEMRLTRSRETRAGDVLAFISRVLYPEPPPIRGWLGTDLLHAFDADNLRDIFGDADVRMDLSAGTIDTVPKGQRPKHEGEHLEHYATWYYRAHVAVSKATHADLAREYRASRESVGVFLRAKDDTRIDERADTKLVRSGIAEAKRLLELPIPPEHWHAYRRYLKF